MSNAKDPLEDHEIDCAEAFGKVYAFLHGELSTEEADNIRDHLMSCEHCMDNFDIEAAIAALIRRSSVTPHAPAQLRTRISMMHVRWETK